MTRRPPTLLARTLAVTFATVAVMLAVVFIILTIETHDRVRAGEIERLQVSERMFTALEARRQHDQMATIATLAENPTLKAALDTYSTEQVFGGLEAGHDDVLTRTVQRETEKLAEAAGGEVLAVVDADGRVITSAGPLADRWPAGAQVDTSPEDAATFQDVAVLPSGAFRVTGARLLFGDRDIGTLVTGNSLDAAYAKELASASHAGIVVSVNGKVAASTVGEAVSRELSAVPLADGIQTLAGEEHAIRALLVSGPVRIYMLTSIDAAARVQTRRAMIELGSVAIGSLLLAAITSLWLARMVTSPINHVAGSIAAMTAARNVEMRLTPSGMSRELDSLAGAFNELLGGLAAAQADTQAAYLGTIRALAATLDARDKYTAGHSERVSEISVRIARQMRLDERDVEVIRFGALLHERRDPPQAGAADARGARADSAPSRPRRAHPAAGDVPGAVPAGRRAASRAAGRRRLSVRPPRRRDPGRRPHRPRRRHARCDDDRARVSSGADTGGGDRRTAAARRHPVRSSVRGGAHRRIERITGIGGAAGGRRVDAGTCGDGGMTCVY